MTPRELPTLVSCVTWLSQYLAYTWRRGKQSRLLPWSDRATSLLSSSVAEIGSGVAQPCLAAIRALAWMWVLYTGHVVEWS